MGATTLPGLCMSFRALCCHPEPFARHSERSEESRSTAQGKLREEPVLNEVKESRSGCPGYTPLGVTQEARGKLALTNESD